MRQHDATNERGAVGGCYRRAVGRDIHIHPVQVANATRADRIAHTDFAHERLFRVAAVTQQPVLLNRGNSKEALSARDIVVVE